MTISTIIERTFGTGPFVVNYGGGVDSTAMIVGLHERGIFIDHILFADTGSEKPETYAYLEEMGRWLEAHELPAIQVVRRYGVDGLYGEASRPSKTGPGYTTIEGNCLQNDTLPSLAFGRKSCSLKWKADPMDKWLKVELASTWDEGRRPFKAIGYDCSPADSRRAVKRDRDELFDFWYPLRDWGWDRELCKTAIVGAGLSIPVKSACFFCPASKPAELREMAQAHPELLARCIELEDNAQPKLQTIPGLWRKGSWREFVEAEGLIPLTPVN